MLIVPDHPLPFIKNYVEQLDNGLKKHSGEGLSVVQKAWLGFCLMGILITNSICWSRYERASFGRYRFSALSWMFRNARICWVKLLPSSVRLILDSHGITEGVLVGDESDRARCKGVKQIHKAHKLKDKKTGVFYHGAIRSPAVTGQPDTHDSGELCVLSTGPAPQGLGEKGQRPESPRYC